MFNNSNQGGMLHQANDGTYRDDNGYICDANGNYYTDNVGNPLQDHEFLQYMSQQQRGNGHNNNDVFNRQNRLYLNNQETNNGGANGSTIANMFSGNKSNMGSVKRTTKPSFNSQNSKGKSNRYDVRGSSVNDAHVNTVKEEKIQVVMPAIQYIVPKGIKVKYDKNNNISNVTGREEQAMQDVDIKRVEGKNDESILSYSMNSADIFTNIKVNALTKKKKNLLMEIVSISGLVVEDMERANRLYDIIINAESFAEVAKNIGKPTDPVGAGVNRILTQIVRETTLSNFNIDVKFSDFSVDMLTLTAHLSDMEPSAAYPLEKILKNKFFNIKTTMATQRETIDRISNGAKQETTTVGQKRTDVVDNNIKSIHISSTEIGLYLSGNINNFFKMSLRNGPAFIDKQISPKLHEFMSSTMATMTNIKIDGIPLDYVDINIVDEYQNTFRVTKTRDDVFMVKMY